MNEIDELDPILRKRRRVFYFLTQIVVLFVFLPHLSNSFFSLILGDVRNSNHDLFNAFSLLVVFIGLVSIFLIHKNRKHLNISILVTIFIGIVTFYDYSINYLEQDYKAHLFFYILYFVVALIMQLSSMLLSKDKYNQILGTKWFYFISIAFLVGVFYSSALLIGFTLF